MKSLLPLLLLLAGTAAMAGVFSYRDENGTLHAVSNEQDIPEKYRAKSRKLAGSESGSGEVNLKLVREGNSLLIPVTFGNAGEYYMILDTGASSTMISTRIAEKLKPKKIGTANVATASGVIEVPIVEIQEMSVRQLKVSGLSVAVNNLPGRPDSKAQGLLGVDFLNHFRMQIDTETGQVHFERK